MIDLASLSEEELYQFLIEHMGIVGEKISKARPAPFVAPPIGPEPVVVLAEWALTLYKGIHVLIHRRLPDPAQLLARTLLEGAIRLAHFRLQPAKLEELAVRWTVEALTEEQAATLSASIDPDFASEFASSVRMDFQARA